MFDDIDEEAKALARAGTPSGTASASIPSADPSPTPVLAMAPKSPPIALSKDEEQRIMESAVEAATGIGGNNGVRRQESGDATMTATTASVPTQAAPSKEGRGVLQRLGKMLPWSGSKE